MDERLDGLERLGLTAEIDNVQIGAKAAGRLVEQVTQTTFGSHALQDLTSRIGSFEGKTLDKIVGFIVR